MIFMQQPCGQPTRTRTRGAGDRIGAEPSHSRSASVPPVGASNLGGRATGVTVKIIAFSRCKFKLVRPGSSRPARVTESPGRPESLLDLRHGQVLGQARAELVR